MLASARMISSWQSSNILASGQPGRLASNRAGQARNPKGPQITPFCHQMGRHPTVLDISGAEMRRIPARISPWGSWGLNPHFFLTHFGPKNANKSIFWQVFEFTWPVGFQRLFPGAQGAPRGPRGPQGAQGGPKGPLGGPWGAIFPKSEIFCGGFPFLRRTHRNGLAHGAPGGPKGPLGGPRGPLGPPKGPKGAQGAPWAPLGPLGPLLGGAREGSLHWS